MRTIKIELQQHPGNWNFPRAIENGCYTCSQENKEIINNYRLISLLPKIVSEKMLFEKLCNHLVSNNLIVDNQSRFRPGDSDTIDQNVKIYIRPHLHLYMTNLIEKVKYQTALAVPGKEPAPMRFMRNLGGKV